MVNAYDIRNELREGNYYYCTWSSPSYNVCKSIAYITSNFENENKLNIHQILIHQQKINKTDWDTNTSNIQRRATLEEIAWFRYCISNNQYISQEEFLELKNKQKLFIW